MMKGPKVFDIQSDKENQIAGGFDELKNDLKNVSDPSAQKVLKKIIKLVLGKDA